MKTVRFSKVVAKCGKPEVYLLMTETDPDFQKALHADRIMSLSDDSYYGAGTEYGKVGYDKKRKGQLLMFPKTLKAFDKMKVVGIKYNLFAEEEISDPPPKQKAKAEKAPSKGKTHSATKPEAQAPKKTEKRVPAKVIYFPKPEADEEDDDENESVAALKGYARQAMRALEKNNSVAAYNLLKCIVEE